MLSTITARLTKKNDEYIASITGGMGTIDKNTGELRSTYDILQDLSKAWDNLTSVEKQELAETVAGKTQRSLFTAIMTNFNSAVGATEAALNSEGSAAEENAKRMDSLQGKVQQLESAWQNFSRNTVNSDFIKNILSTLTNLIKLVDKVGGLSTVLAAATAALMLFKGGLIIDKAFNVFTSGLNMIKNGLTTVTTALPNAIAAFKSFSAGVVSAGTAIEAAAPLLSLIALAITGVVQGLNAYKNAQKEATQAAIESSQKAKEEADNKKAKIETTEKEIKKLEEERDTLLKNSEKMGENGTASRNLAQDKQKEIEKRQQNIDKMKEEAAESLKQREAAARSMKTNKADSSGLGNAGFMMGVKSVNEEFEKFRQNIDDSNKKLKEADGNTGAYQRTLEQLRSEYEAQAQEREKNGEKAMAETDTINRLNKEIEDNSKKYEEDKKVADEFYSIIKDGGSISQENLEWMQEFLGLTDEQIEKLKEGTDVLKEDTDAKSNNAEVQEELNNKMQEAQNAADNWNSKLQDNIDQMKNYGDNMDILNVAQQELANSGAITAETFEQITQNNLLGYLDEVDGKLQVNTNSFINSTQSIKDNAIANLEASTYEQIRAVVLEDMKNKEVDAGNAAATASGQLSAAGSQAQIMGAKMLEASGNVAVLTAQLNELNKAEGGSGQVSGDTTKKVQNILSQASKTKAFIESWKPSTSSSAKKSSGGSRRKSSGGSGRKSGSGSKSSSKSTKEEYKAEIDTLYAYKNALDNAKDSVDKLNDALKDTDNFNEQEKILRQLIDATNNQINKTNELKNAQSAQMNNYINQLRAQGFAIDYNASKNELFINNMQHLADFSGDTAKNLEKLIKKIQDLNNDNRSLDGSVRDLTGNVKDYYKQLEDIPEKKLKKFNELMKDFQQNRLDQIQNQIDDIKHEMDNDERIKAIDKQIEALEAENDTLDSQKELEEKILAVEQAKEKLANANRQKTLQVYTEDAGWQWVADPDTIKDAADELKQAQDDLNDKIKQDEIDRLKEEKSQIEESYQNRIDALQKFLDEQNYQIDKANREGIQSFQDLQKELAKFGLDSAQYLGKATDWLNNYNKSLADLNNTVNGILSSSSQATDGLIYSSAVQDRINQALSSIIPVTTQTGLKLNQIDYDKIKGNTDNQSIYINNIELPNVKDIDDFVEALKDLPRMATSQSTMRT